MNLVRNHVKPLPNRTIMSPGKKKLSKEQLGVAHAGKMFLGALFLMLAVGILHGSNVTAGTLDYWSAFAVTFLFSAIMRYALRDDD